MLRIYWGLYVFIQVETAVENKLENASGIKSLLWGSEVRNRGSEMSSCSNLFTHTIRGRVSCSWISRGSVRGVIF